MNTSPSSHKKMLRPAFLLPFLLPPLLLFGVELGGIWAFLPLVVVFGLIPIVDLIIGQDYKNPDESILPDLINSRFHLWLLYAWVPIQLAVLVWGVWRVTQGIDPLTFTGLVLSVGVITGGIGITVAHELGHKRSPFDQALARILLITVAYLHFLVEHNRGHHARVATPDDPATARFGESFYRFYPRTVIGSWTSAWHLEKERMQRLGLGFFHRRNQMLWAIVGPLTLAVAFSIIAGPLGLVFFIGQAFIGFTLLELVNYIEHYGLERQPRDDGYYEKVTIQHSWNASDRLTNYMLFNLQRHSHHHAHSITPYQALRHFDESPQLPTGYAGMIVIALVPPLWRRVMDPRASYYREHVLGVEG